MNLDPIGLLDRIIKSGALIDTGRKGLDTDGSEHKGRIAYKSGLADAMAAFVDAEAIGDVQLLISAELVFLNEELRFCDKEDTDAQKSTTQAISSFEDALLALAIVLDSSGYRAADKTYPHNDKSRLQGMPKDAVHLACNSHRTRLQNALRPHGINMAEKALLKQRRSNLATIQSAYLEQQKVALPVGDHASL